MYKYKCAVCKKFIDVDVSVVGLQCDNCGSKIFYKERPNITKKIKAR